MSFGLAFAQFASYNHPELKWQTIETEHFAVHYHDGTERTARDVAGIAEEVFKPVTDLYGYRPEGRIHFIIRDHDDYSNGASYYYDQKIEIWCSPLDFELRGQHHWLYDVVTHEFTHMIQLGASRKGPRWLPGIYFQVIDYEPEKRPDVLYGYPNRIASWPITLTTVPMWFAEGAAQFQAENAHHDWWDSHRDMMLRARALEGKLLTLNQMEVFGKNTLGSEYVYNQGYSLVGFIARKWGDDALARLTNQMSKLYRWDFNSSCREVLGVSENELYALWNLDLSADYESRIGLIRDNLCSGAVVRDEGFGNLYPAFSPGGDKIAFVSNKDKDYLSLGRTVIYDVAKDTVVETDCPNSDHLDWSPNGKYLLYAREKGPDKHGSHFNDLYLWDVAGKKEIRLTHEARLNYPAFSADGKTIVAIHSQDGTHNLALLTLPDTVSGKDVSIVVDGQSDTVVVNVADAMNRLPVAMSACEDSTANTANDSSVVIPTKPKHKSWLAVATIWGYLAFRSDPPLLLATTAMGVAAMVLEHALRKHRVPEPTKPETGLSAVKIGSDVPTLLTLPDTVSGKGVSAEIKWTLLTDFNDGRQIYSPVISPDGKWIVCASSLYNERDLYRFDLDTKNWHPLIATEFDERDPRFSTDGKWLYWSDDRTGLFNLYRLNLETGVEEAMSNVIGGAFMPSVNDSGMIAYSEFTGKGFGVRLIKEPQPVSPGVMLYEMPSEREGVETAKPPALDQESKPYATPFTQLSVLPRIAWDYGKFKPGFYAYTGDLLDKLTLFGGAQMNGAGERDLYLNAEYRVLYPTLFVEAYNIMRKNRERFDDTFRIIGERYVDSTAVPIYDSYAVDYKFNLAEYDLGGRVPLGDNFNATASVRISGYNAALRFDDGGSFDYTYFKGSAFILHLDADLIARAVESDIHPSTGWNGWVEYARENNRFLDSFRVDLEKGFLKEVYQPYNYHRLETDVEYHLKLYHDLVLNPRLIGGWISKPVDSFFNLNAGGLPGLRGYSFYSLGGTRKLVTRLAMRFPILTDLDRSWGPFYLDRIHGSVFVEAGDAWAGKSEGATIKKDIGAELRLKMFSWYGFPTDIQFAGAYGLDQFHVNDASGVHTYGHEWRWYFTVLFGFL